MNDKEIVHAILSMAVILGLLMVGMGVGVAIADDTSYRVGVMPFSKHLRADGLNEQHGGVLVEYQWNTTTYLGGMRYNNSYRETSNAVYMGYSKRQNSWLSIGIQGGLITGYEGHINAAGAISPYATGTLTVDHGKLFKSRLLLTPVVIAYQFILEVK